MPDTATMQFESDRTIGPDMPSHFGIWGVAPGSSMSIVVGGHVGSWAGTTSIRLTATQGDIQNFVMVFGSETLHPKTSPPEIQAQFRRLAEQWKRATEHESAEWRRTEHPAHEAIVNLGWDVVPALLHDIQAGSGVWFSALAEITGENPAAGTRTYQDAVRAWCDWGARRGYL